MSPRTTHVANACDCPIWVTCIPNQQTSVSFVAQQTENLRAEVNQGAGNAAMLSGLTKINPGNKLAWEKNGQYKPVCLGFVVEANRSVIVDAEYCVKRTKMGEIWIDTDGNDHS
ncbi:unnamed protein product [Adineta ricciae]|uniref:Uncharacterized protein n=1 Tax=Adineta ricciae TaxID=249248 RepID=A0A815H1N6_ADIRI|nr:unnamed protein product [Adineta ricciae]CAF1565599.1 unnamed protein product [Adineta ricciae]